LFHAWGFGNFTAGSTMSATTIISLRFDPEQALATIEREHVTTLVVVPVMLQRILELPSEVRKKYDTSSLKLVVASGSAISGDLSTRFMDEFGDVLYNLYGSTEVAWATIATPKDMRAAPGTTGKPPLGTTLKIIDDQGNELPTGETGRVYVTHSMLFEGYTNGGNGDQLADMVGTGDLGHLDEHGRLFIDGRNDEMIISGGENVYPIEIEETISHHEYVVECAVIGVEDEKFGEGLNAFVVLRPDTELSEADLKAYVKQNLARFKVPRKVVFLDELPRNATGKVLKRDLRKL